MNETPASSIADVDPDPRRDSTTVEGNGAPHEPASRLAPADAAPNRGEPVLEMRRVHRYFGKLKAVNDVSFKAYPGQVMGFIGPNGAGKTTSMRILATLDIPTAGDAFVGGYSVIDDPDKVRGILGFMPDSFGKYANMNVVEYLDFYARAYGFRGAKRRDAVERNGPVARVKRRLAERAYGPIMVPHPHRLN